MMTIEIPGGWHPLVSPSGQAVAFGNERMRVWDLRLGVERLVPGLRLPSWPAGWVGEDPVASVQPPVVGARHLVVIRPTGPEPIPFPEEMAPGYRPMRAVWADRVVASTATRHVVGTRLETREHPRAPEDGTIEDVDGRHYLHARAVGNPWAMVVRDVRDGREVRVIRPTTWLKATIVRTDPLGQPWVFSNTARGAELYGPSGEVVTMPPGEWRGGLTWHRGEMLVWTCGIDGAGPFVVARPYAGAGPLDAQAPALVLRGTWYVALDLVAGPSGWVVAGCHGEHGLLTITTCAFDAPRVVFGQTPERPAPTPIPSNPPVPTVPEVPTPVPTPTPQPPLPPVPDDPAPIDVTPPPAAPFWKQALTKLAPILGKALLSWWKKRRAE